ncbi:MAG: adenylate/guanylate cyclase domain-containing protein [Chloroflexota bacterium]|nr:adenylate/guanylate cyclase domain-containing protein [Chloroflexota bacterium]
MNHYLDNIFANIASGVIITNGQGTVTNMNRAAERILAVREKETRKRPFIKALPGLGQAIVPLINTVKQQGRQITAHELSLELPHRGQVFLRLHLSPLKENGQLTTGVAIVMDDLTEHRQLEQQVQHVRETFEHYIPSHLVEQLLSDPANLRLGGVRREVSILFADIRGFVAFGEKVEPEIQIDVLNRHLTLAAEAVLAEEGTLDKFMGDCVMAIFNAPLPQSNHVLRAIRAALSIQRAVAAMHPHLHPNERLCFGIGVTSGQAIVGNIGAAKIHSYTAIGDVVNLAYLLQSHAQPGQILVSAAAYEQVQDHIVAQELGLAHLKGHSEPDRIIELLGLREA